MLYLKDIFYYLILIYRDIPPVYSEHMVDLLKALGFAPHCSGSLCGGHHSLCDVDLR